MSTTRVVNCGSCRACCRHDIIVLHPVALARDGYEDAVSRRGRG
jgi:hypothetical protein